MKIRTLRLHTSLVQGVCPMTRRWLIWAGLNRFFASDPAAVSKLRHPLCCHLVDEATSLLPPATMAPQRPTGCVGTAWVVSAARAKTASPNTTVEIVKLRRIWLLSWF